MTVTASTRLGLTRWSAGTDPLTRAQIDGSFAKIDDLAAIDLQGTLAARPAAGVRGRYYFVTDNNLVYRDSGTAWHIVGSPLGGGLPTVSAVGDAGAEGTSGNAARNDHRHAREAFSTAAPANVALNASATVGGSVSPARADHSHFLGTQVPVASVPGDAAAQGTAGTVALGDHRHAREAFGAVVAQTGFGAASGSGVAATLARSDHTHGTPNGGTMTGALALEGVVSGAGINTLFENARAGLVVHGGGVVSLSGATELRWTTRMIAIAHRGGGHYDIAMPADGAIITGINGAANQTVTAGGIPMAGGSSWDALYFAPGLGLRLTGYSTATPTRIPADWIYIAGRNGDNNTIFVNSIKAFLKPGDSVDVGARGTGPSQFVTMASSQTVGGDKSFTGRTVIDRDTTGTSYTTASFEIQDTGIPRISFHQPGAVASSFGQVDGSEAFRTYNNGGTGYANLHAILFDQTNRVYSANNVPPYPVTSVNGRTGAVSGLLEATAHAAGVTMRGTKTLADLPSAYPAGGSTWYTDATSQWPIRYGVILVQKISDVDIHQLVVDRAVNGLGGGMVWQRFGGATTNTWGPWSLIRVEGNRTYENFAYNADGTVSTADELRFSANTIAVRKTYTYDAAGKVTQEAMQMRGWDGTTVLNTKTTTFNYTGDNITSTTIAVT